MAMSYQNFASLGVNLNRQKYGPLDISNVFTSVADLKYYLTKGTFTEGVSEYWYKNANEKIVPYPYEGQVLATVIDGVVSVYALSLDADGNFQTQEIGAKIETDDKTIKLVDGKLELVGLPTEVSGKTFVPSLVNGVLTWAEPDTSTAEGQAQEIEGLKTRTTALETTVNGKAAVGEEGAEGYVPAVVGLVDKVAALEAVDNATQAELDAYKEVVTAAIAAGVKEAKDYADANDADTIYDDSALAARVKALEDEERYDDTDLKNRVDALEGVVGDAENGLVKDVAANTKAISDMDAAYKQADADNLAAAKTYTDEEIAGLTVSIEQKEGVEYIVVKDKAGNEVTSANASKFVQDSFLDDVSYNPETRKVSFTWSMGDGSTKTDEIEIGDLVDTYTAGNGLTVIDNEFAIDTNVVATVEALNAVSEVAEAAQTAEEVASAIDAKITEANLGQYAKASDVETALEGKVNVADYNTDKATFALKTDVENTFGGYYTKTEIDDKGYAVASDVASTYATKDELSTHEENFENELLAYAKTADVNAELAKKIETATITHATEEKAEGVTVDGTALNIVVDAYTKAETLAQIEEIMDQLTDSSENAATVAIKLDNHITAYTEKVGQIDTKNGEQDTAIATAQAQADKGVADAAKVAGDLVTANQLIADNTREIGVAKSSIETVNTTLTEKITALESKDTTIEGNITALQTTVGGHTTTITEQGVAIAALQTRDTELATLIQGNTDKFANYSTTEQVNKAIDDKIAAIPDVDFTGYATETYVTDAIAVVNAEVAKKADKTDLDNYYTKTDADNAFMTEGEVDARINALINAADPEGGKVISNIQNLVKYVEENAGEIAGLVTTVGEHTTAIADNAAAIAANKSAHEKNASDIVDINALIAANEVKSSSEISVAAVEGEGTTGVQLSINSVSTDKLVQGTDTLVLNGGSAV